MLDVWLSIQCDHGFLGIIILPALVYFCILNFIFQKSIGVYWFICFEIRCSVAQAGIKKNEGSFMIFDLENLGVQHLWKPAVDTFLKVSADLEMK